MRKWFIKFITLVLSAIVAASCFSGCNLVTDNTERDYDQVIATVNINVEENIYKKDLIMGYLNYGYVYTQYYGYDLATTYKTILNGLIENRIVVQVACEKFEKGDADLGIERTVNPNYVNASGPEKYLSDDEILEAKYQTYKSINELLDGYTEDDSATKKDALTVTVRTVKTDASNAEKEVNKQEYVDKGFDVNSNEFRRAAFNKVIKLLKDNNLLGNNYKGTMETTLYYEKLLLNNYENQLISNYEDAILNIVIKELSYDDLCQLYDEKFSEQSEWSDEEFASALSSASADNPVLVCNAQGTYGYVYNLLLGVNEYQSEKITELQEERVHEVWTEEDYAEERAKVLAGTIAQDLRASWILSGYDFDFDTKTFTGDYTFAKNAENSLAFQGEVEKIEVEGEEDDLYSVKNVKTFGLDDFITFVNNYLYGENKGGKNLLDANIYWEYNSGNDKPAEYDAKINELLFAFSTDSGSLNSYKGYVIKPDNNDYVKTFTEAGKALLSEGGSSYKVVASDYGYHFMFFSEVWQSGKKYSDLDTYLDSLDLDKENGVSWADYFAAKKADWEKFEEDKGYLYILAGELISERLSAKSSQSKTALINEYRYGEDGKVKLYESRYADLIG